MKKAPGKQIKVRKNGPYELTGDIELDQAIVMTDGSGMPIGWEKGKTYHPQDRPGYLCRCGHSHDKPFCDGTHNDTKFCGHEKATLSSYADTAQLLERKTVGLMDDPSLCIGVRFCDVGETVWGYVEQSEIPGNAEKAAEEACNCPSGRLTVVDDGGNCIEPKLRPSVSVIEDPINDCRGPIWVKGGIEVIDANGESYEVRNRVTLCRCGESENQPYCDGKHYNCEHMQGLD